MKTALHRPLYSLAIALFSLLAALPLTGCLMIGGYSSRGGFYIWPGSIIISLIFLFVFFLRRRR